MQCSRGIVNCMTDTFMLYLIEEYYLSEPLGFKILTFSIQRENTNIYRSHRKR